MSQTYRNYEHVFIDGESNDETISIIKGYYSNAIIHMRRDSGVYDAFNRGLELVNGDIVGFLHSDDFFTDDSALERIAGAFQAGKNIAYYCSRMINWDPVSGKVVTILGKDPETCSTIGDLRRIHHHAHPTYYVRKNVMDQIGKYQVCYKLAADFDWLKRLERASLDYHYDPQPLVVFRLSGLSARNYIRALVEDFHIVKNYEGVSVRMLLIFALHFIRRVVRFFLEVNGMHSIVALLRKKLKIFFAEVPESQNLVVQRHSRK